MLRSTYSKSLTSNPGKILLRAQSNVLETSGSANRTTTTTYDAAGREVLEKATGTIPGATTVPASFTHYNAAGLVDYTGDANAAGDDATANRITTGYDIWGREISYRMGRTMTGQRQLKGAGASSHGLRSAPSEFALSLVCSGGGRTLILAVRP